MAKAAVVETTSENTAIERAASGPKRLAEFLKDTRQEMEKVVDAHPRGSPHEYHHRDRDRISVCGVLRVD